MCSEDQLLHMLHKSCCINAPREQLLHVVCSMYSGKAAAPYALVRTADLCALKKQLLRVLCSEIGTAPAVLNVAPCTLLPQLVDSCVSCCGT